MNPLISKENSDIYILIVDDDDVTRTTTAKVLEKTGYQVISVNNGQDAINLCMDKLPDLVLLDLMMPGLNGYDTCKALRSLTDHNLLPIITLTGLNDLESIDKAFESGSTDFITKPINWSLLIQRVRYALRTRDLFRELVKSKKKLSKAFNIARIGYWEYDSTNQTFYIFDETKYLLGLNKSSYTAEELLAFTSAEDRKKIESRISTTLNSGTPYLLKHSFINHSGTELILNQQGELINRGDRKVIIGTLQDITKQTRDEKKIHFHRYYDESTSLPNKEFFIKKLTQITQDDSYQSLTAVIYLSFDKLQNIGSTIGSHFIDEFLICSCKRIIDSVPEIDEISRIGDVTIGFLLKNNKSSEQIEAICTLIIQLFKFPLKVFSSEFHTNLSIGISLYPYDGDANTLINNTSMAHKNCIDMGGSKYLFFNKEMNTLSNKNILLENKMRSALKNNEFTAFFQPQICTETNSLTGMEALARWIEPDGNFIYPDTFIPIAEESGLIIELGRSILFQSCVFAKHLSDKNMGDIRVGVNLSALQFSDNYLIKNIEAALNETGLDPSQLEIEITESTAMTDIDHAISTLNKIRELGIKTSMDDFGTGYSSLSYLQKLPLDTLKIDQSFIRPIGPNGENSEIAKAIINMGIGLNMQLIAEGAEEKYHYDLLKELGCHEVQGYYFSKPVAQKDFEFFITDQINSKF